MSRKRPKSLDAEVYRKLWQLEHYAYVRCHQWKKTYRYTLINEFREHITSAKNNFIMGFELLRRFKNSKAGYYNAALAELSMVESNMEHMIADDIGIMSEKDWAQAAIMIDSIRVELGKLISSLNANGTGFLQDHHQEGIHNGILLQKILQATKTQIKTHIVMMKFAKIVCGTIQIPQIYPGYIELNGRRIYHPTEEQYRAAGYLPLYESEPEEREGKVAIATYKMDKRKTKIVQTWIYEDIEPEPTPEPTEE